MGGIYTVTFTFLCLFYFLTETKSSFIKPNNVPRVGRSNEGEGIFDQTAMGYVIKTIPSKNIPRMGRRNYDSENKYDIPKFYHLPAEAFESYEGGEHSTYEEEPLDVVFNKHLENMK